MSKISVLTGDVLSAPVDVLILKCAERHRGADLAVYEAIRSTELQVAKGKHKFVSSNGKISATDVLSVGVGPLNAFDYPQISEFVRQAIGIIRTERPLAKKVGITLHGPGYGLDELGSIHALVEGALGALIGAPFELLIVEQRTARAERIRSYLAGQNQPQRHSSDVLALEFDRDLGERLSDGGAYRKRIFTAMPFAKKFLDHWEFALQPAGHSLNLLMERLDHEYFTGDIVAEIKERIERASAVIALLDDSNPNVFLEVGYSWAKGKPTVLVLNNAQQPPFDVQGQRLLRYERLGELRDSLISWLRELEASKVF